MAGIRSCVLTDGLYTHISDNFGRRMGDEVEDFPYRAEYAKSGRAKCKACKADIPKGDLRLASMTQSAFFDGKQANWFHSNCFFMRNRPKAVGEIAHFDSLRLASSTLLYEIINHHC